MPENNEKLKALIQGLYQKENPEKAQRLNDDVINNIISTYNGDYKAIVKGLYDKENPEKAKRLNDDVFANIATSFGLGEPYSSTNEEIDYGPFDKATVEKYPQARQNFERWQETNGKLQENAVVPPGADQNKVNIPSDSETNVMIPTPLGFMPSNPKAVGTFLVDAGQKFAEGAAYMGEWLPHIQNMPYKVAANVIAKRNNVPLEQKQATVEAMMLMNPFTSGSEVIADELKKAQKSLAEKSDRYKGQDFAELWSKGDKAGAVGQIFLEGMKSVPISLGAMLGGAPAMGLIGLGTAATEYDELTNIEKPSEFASSDEWKQYTDKMNMSEFSKVSNAILKGTGEALSEYLFSKPVAIALKKIPGADKIVTKGIAETAKKFFNKYGLLTEPVVEGIEEFANSLWGSAVDSWTGAKEWNTKQAVTDAAKAFAYGFGGGAQFAVGAGITKAIGERGQQPATPEQQPFTVGDQATKPVTPEMSPKDMAILQITNEANGMLDKSGNITTVTDKSGKIHVVKDPDDTTGMILVLDDNGKVTGLPSKDFSKDKMVTVTPDEYIAAKMSEFDQMQAAKEQVKNSVIDYKGKKFVPNGAQIEGGDVVLQEVAEDEQGNIALVDDSFELLSQEDYNSIVQAKQEAEKQQTPGTAPKKQVVNSIKLGKTDYKYTTEEDGTFTILIPEGADPAKVEKDVRSSLPENEQNRVQLIQEEIEVPPSVPWGKPTKNNVVKSIKILPENNQNAIMPPSQENKTSEIDPEIQKQVNEETQPSYTFNGQEIDRETAQGLIEVAALQGKPEKLTGLVLNNDPELTKLVQTSFPEKKPSYKLGNRNITPAQAKAAILSAESIDELNQVKIANDSQFDEIIKAKQNEFKAQANQQKAEENRSHNNQERTEQEPDGSVQDIETDETIEGQETGTIPEPGEQKLTETVNIPSESEKKLTETTKTLFDNQPAGEITEQKSSQKEKPTSEGDLQNVQTIEEKKAYIERRRQEELEKETPIKNEKITVDFGGGVSAEYQVITYKDGSVKIATVSDRPKRYSRLSDEAFKDYAKIDFESDAKGIIKTELVRDDYTDKQSQEIKAAKENTINAKYDAELAALEKTYKQQSNANTKEKAGETGQEELLDTVTESKNPSNNEVAGLVSEKEVIQQARNVEKGQPLNDTWEQRQALRKKAQDNLVIDDLFKALPEKTQKSLLNRMSDFFYKGESWKNVIEKSAINSDMWVNTKDTQQIPESGAIFDSKTITDYYLVGADNQRNYSRKIPKEFYDYFNQIKDRYNQIIENNGNPLTQSPVSTPELKEEQKEELTPAENDVTKVTIIPKGTTPFAKQAQLYIKSYLDSIKVKDKVKFSEGKPDFDLFALLDNDGNIISLHKSAEEAYHGALNSDIEDLNIVRETKEGKNLTYDYYTGTLFGDAIGDLYEDNGNLKESVKQDVINDIKKQFNIEKESLTTEKPKSPFLDDRLEEASKKKESKVKEPWEMTSEEFVSKRVTEILDSMPNYGKTDNAKWKQQERKNAETKALNEWIQANEKAFIDGKDVKYKPTWALTAKQWAERSDDTLDSILIESHRKIVEQAIKDKKPVPANVKAEYTELFEEKINLSEYESNPANYDKTKPLNVTQLTKGEKYLTQHGSIMTFERLTNKKESKDNDFFVDPKGVISVSAKFYPIKPFEEKPISEDKKEEVQSPVKGEEQTGIEKSAAKYGWTAEKQPNGDYKLSNRNGKYVADVKGKDGKYTISREDGEKLLSGNKDVAGAVEKVIRDYFYGKEVEQKDIQPETTEKEFTVSANDVSFERARRAHMAISFNPEKRAKQVQDEYVSDMESLRDELYKIANTPEMKAEANRQLEKYKEGYLQKLYAWLDAKGRTMSSMITGPARFPIERNQKALDVESKRNNEFVEWNDKFVKNAKKYVQGKESVEAKEDRVWESLRKYIIEQVGTIKGIDTGRLPGYNRTLFVTPLSNFVKKLFNNGQFEHTVKAIDYIRELQAGLTKPIFAESNAVWGLKEQAQQKIDTKEERPEQEAQENETIYSTDEIEVVNNREIERVQIITPNKPSQAVINQLKSAGWNWSPSNKAWQRKNTPEGIRAALKFAEENYPKESDVNFNMVEDNLPETVIVNGKERPTTNSKGRPIHPTIEGIRNFYEWFGNSKAVDEQGRPIVVYSGHANTAMFGNKFNKRKATSGGFYVSESPDVASGYALGKIGEKEYYENGDQYRFADKKGNFTKKLWQLELTEKQKQKIDDLASQIDEYEEPKFGIHYMKEWAKNNYRYDPLARRIASNPYNLFNIWQFNEMMGHNIAYDKQKSYPKQPVFELQQKNETEQIFDELGIKWSSYQWSSPGVFPLYIRVEKPLDADKEFPADVLEALKKEAKKERTKTNETAWGNDDRAWTKDYPLKLFVADIENGDEYWTTQVPKKALEIFRQFGYDGYKERGDKASTATREERNINWVAFDAWQLKSAIANKGTYNAYNDDINLNISKPKSGSTDSKQEIISVLNEIQSKAPGAAKMVIVQNKMDLLNAIEGITDKAQYDKVKNKEGGVRGLFHKPTDTIFINMEHVGSIDEAIAVWVHENGWHKGIRNIVPARMVNDLFKKIYYSVKELAKTNTELQKMVDHVEANYTGEVEQGNEFAAYLAGRIIKQENLLPVEKTLWEQIKDFVKELLGKVFKFNSDLLTEKEIANLIQAAVQSNFNEKPSRKDYPFLTDYLDAVSDWKDTPARFNNPSEIPDNYFIKPLRPVMLPSLPKSILKAISIDAKPVIIKEKIFKKNKRNHKELSPEDSRYILQSALYNPDLIGRSQPKKREYYWVAVKLAEKNATVVIDVYPGKDVVEIVGWRLIDNKGLERLKKQAEREDEQLLILSPETGSAAALSTLPFGVSDNKGTNLENENQIPETITINGVERPTRNSNGQFIHPTLKGIKNFYKWFGDSKVVDEQGRPLVVYHGTDADFNTFNSKVFPTAGYFSKEPDIANLVAHEKIEYHKGNGSIYPVYLSLKIPLDLNNINGKIKYSIEEFTELFPVEFNDKIKNELSKTYKYPSPIWSYLADKNLIDFIKANGYDGVLYKEGEVDIELNQYLDVPVNNTEALIAFFPTQIKSATGNNGEFDSGNPIINFMTGLWHGSPHKFNRFSTDYMGTGEGAQAYGWGLYFTDKEGIAKEYAEKLTRNKLKDMYESGEDMPSDLYDALNNIGFLGFDNEWQAANVFFESSKSKVMSNYDVTEKEYDAVNEAYKKDSRNLYKVKIHGDKTLEELNFLRWDKPLTEEQRNYVINGIIELAKQGESLDNFAIGVSIDAIVNKNVKGFKVGDSIEYKYAARNKIPSDIKVTLVKNINGAELYGKLSIMLKSDKEASLFLLRAGIDGIQYPSEYTTKGQHEDSFNYVVFDENAVEIEEQIQFATDRKRTFIERITDLFKGKDSKEIREAAEVIYALNEASNYDDEVVIMDNENVAKELKANNYSNDFISGILKTLWRGLNTNGKIYIHPRIAKDRLFVAATTVHEKVHNHFNDKFSKPYKREKYFNELFNLIGKEEIQRLLPSYYLFGDNYTQAEEYVTHISEALVYKIAENKDQSPEAILNELLSGVKDNAAKKAIFEAINETINLNNLQDVTRKISLNLPLVQQGGKESITHDGRNNRSGIRRSYATDENGEIITGASVSENEQHSREQFFKGIRANFAVLGEYGAANLDKAEEATTRLDNLRVAKEMETSGKDAKTILLATGWQRGSDLRWRYEVPDNITVNKIPEVKEGSVSEPYKFNEIFDAKDLLQAYPDINGMMVTFVNSQDNTKGQYIKEANVLIINTNEKLHDRSLRLPSNDTPFKIGEERNDYENDLGQTILHEIQHFIQANEGFAEGNSSETIQRLYPELIDREIANERGLVRTDVLKAIKEITAQERSDIAFQIYQKGMGEVEARNAAKRVRLTPEQRRQTLLEETEDVSRKDQIFLNEALGEAKSENTIPETITIDGTFDETNSSIEFSKGGRFLDNVLDEAAEANKVKKETKSFNESIQRMREFWQDVSLPVRKLEEEIKKRGGKITNKSKPYRDINLSFGRIEELYRQFTDNKMKPVIEAITDIAKSGINVDYIIPYVYAKHAEERNREMRMAEYDKWINANEDATESEREDFLEKLQLKDYSGVSGFDPHKTYENPDELARDIVKEFEEQVPEELINTLWEKINDATGTILEHWRDGGQLSEKQYDKLKKQYQYFVPLRNWRHGKGKQFTYVKGEGFGRSLRKAYGRKTLADNPLAYIQAVGFKAIGERVDNEIKNSMLNLVLSNYKPEFQDLYHIKKVYYIKTIQYNTETGENEEIWEATLVKPSEKMFSDGDARSEYYGEHMKLRSKYEALQHEVIVHREGGDVAIIFDRENPDLLPVAHAMNRQNVMYEFLGKVHDSRDLHSLAKVTGAFGMTNFMKGMFTSKNPVFPFTNFFRDVPEAALTMLIMDANPNVIPNIPHAMAAARRRIYGKPDMSNQYDQWLAEFYETGGATGFTHEKTPEEIEKELTKEIEKILKSQGFKGKTANTIKDVFHAVDKWNQLFEDTTRFAVYVSSRKAGKTKEEAAIDAKEASVNFNRKGKGTKFFDSIWAFFNPAIQAAQKNFKLAKDHPGRFAAVAGTVTMLGFIEALLNDMGDDDDDEYYQLNDYVRQNYAIIHKFWGDKDKYIRIPLPQFWRGFHSLGVISYDWLVKGSTKAGEAAAQTALNFMGGLSPVDIPGFWVDGEFSISPIVPTWAKPVVETQITNRDFMGNRIAIEPFTKALEKELANSSLHKKNVNPAAKMFTDFLSKDIGDKYGDLKVDFRDNKIKKLNYFLDYNPSKMEHLVKSYLGGAGKVMSDFTTTLFQIVSLEEEVDINNIPFVNSFIRNTPDEKWEVINKYYDLKELAGDLNSVKNYAKRNMDVEKYMEVSVSDLNRVGMVLKVYDDQITSFVEAYGLDNEEGSEKVLNIMQEAVDYADKQLNKK